MKYRDVNTCYTKIFLMYDNHILGAPTWDETLIETELFNLLK